MSKDRVLILEDREAPEFFYVQMVRDELGIPNDSIISVDSKTQALAVDGPLSCVIADLHVLSGDGIDMTPDWEHGVKAIEELVRHGKVAADRVIVVSRYLAMRSEIKQRLINCGVDIEQNAFLLPVDPKKLGEAAKRILGA